MPRIRGIAGAVTLAVGSVGFGLFAATAGAQAVGGTSSSAVTGTAKAGTTTATSSVTTGGSGTTPAAAPTQVPAAPAPATGGGGTVIGSASAASGSGSSNQVQVIAGNHTGPCSPIVAQQVNNSNTTAANNNGSANNSPTHSVSNGNDVQPGNGRGTGDIGNIKNNTVNQNVNVSCFNNSSPQTVIVPQTRTIVVPGPTQTIVQQAPVAAPVVTQATFTG